MVKKLLTLLSLILVLGFLIPEDRVIPVVGASAHDWNKDTFWYEPWGSSGVHKGVDIFASNNTDVVATTNMIKLYSGDITKGGKVILALGPKWRLHYFAHLSGFNSRSGLFLHRGEQIGKVGSTGNAKGKQPHLHYSIVSLLPVLWKIDASTQGYKKAFYLDPTEYLSSKYIADGSS